MPEATEDSVSQHTKDLLLRLSAMQPDDFDAVTFAIDKAIEDAVIEERSRFGALVEAMDQLLDDMGPSGQSVCLAAKAQARVAFDPWLDQDCLGFVMALDEAKRVIAEADRG